MNEQLPWINANVKAGKGFISYTLLLSVLSIIIKSLLFRPFTFRDVVSELLLGLLCGILLILLHLRYKRQDPLSNYELLRNSLKIAIFVAILTNPLITVLTLKYGPTTSIIEPVLYTNIFIILLSGGAVFLILRNESSFHQPSLLHNKNTYLQQVLAESLYLVLLFTGALIFSFVLKFVFNYSGKSATLIVPLVILFLNIISHYLFFSIYEWRRAREKESSRNGESGIISKTLIVFVALYATLAISKDITQLIYTLNIPSIPPFIILIHDLDLLIFGYTTMFMTFVIFSLRRSLNNAYPHTKQLVNGAVTIWLMKLINNALIRLNHELLPFLKNYQNTHNMIDGILTTIALIFNLSLLICGLFIISKNTFPHGKLWFFLAIVQVINFGFNISFSLGGAVTPVLKLYVNFALTILKFLFVFLIIIRYQRCT